jgi:HPt (histidine-containing phosphotransfer) domain-containing protein
MDHPETIFEELKSDSFDPLALWERVNGDMDLLRDLVGLFAQEYPGLLSNIEAAIQQGSFTDLQRFSHKLKGSALQFSGRQAVAVAGALEKMGATNSLESADQLFLKLKHEVLYLMKVLNAMIGLERPLV